LSLESIIGKHLGRAIEQDVYIALKRDKFKLLSAATRKKKHISTMRPGAYVMVVFHFAPLEYNKSTRSPSVHKGLFALYPSTAPFAHLALTQILLRRRKRRADPILRRAPLPRNAVVDAQTISASDLQAA
jgi:hypothetical protein